MNVKRQSNGQTISLGRVLAKGGTASIYEVPQVPLSAAKIYNMNLMNDKTSSKLEVMFANPPSDPMKATGHVSFTWPMDILLLDDASNKVIGYLMQSIEGMRPLVDYYDSISRPWKYSAHSYDHLCRIALNLASVVTALHDSGYLIGNRFKKGG